MCGRLVVVVPDLSVFIEPLHVARLGPTLWQPRFNIAPTQLAPVVTNETDRRLELFHFGLVPGWAKDKKIASKLINARVEGVATSNAFKRALAQRRCIVPVSGYYEWQTLHGQKRALYIHDARKTFLPLAGIWERWHSQDGEVLESFAVLTRPATGFLRDVHDRMPLSVPWSAIDLWLDPAPQDAGALASILQSASAVDHLTAHAVAPIVNSPSNDSPECIAPFVAGAPAPEPQLDLFEAIARPRTGTQR
ncbi:MAG TPA: SOS response-associated peptidase [Polyangiales bacterium]|jgi:putative SOS response-associated peptidase YedK